MFCNCSNTVKNAEILPHFAFPTQFTWFHTGVVNSLVMVHIHLRSKNCHEVLAQIVASAIAYRFMLLLIQFGEMSFANQTSVERGFVWTTECLFRLLLNQRLHSNSLAQVCEFAFKLSLNAVNNFLH